MNQQQIALLTETLLKTAFAFVAVGVAIRAWILRPLRNRRDAEKKASFVKVRADKSIHGEF